MSDIVRDFEALFPGLMWQGMRTLMRGTEPEDAAVAAYDRAAIAFRGSVSASDNAEFDRAMQSFLMVWRWAERDLLRSMIGALTTPGTSIPPVQMMQSLLNGATMTEATKPIST